MKHLSRKKLNLKKITALAIAVNAIQIIAALGLLIYVIFSRSFNIPEQLEITLIALMAGVIAWGAAVDIHDAYITRKLNLQRDMLEEAYGQLEKLNRTLRGQRHDFKNHLQVVYSLCEMGAYEDMQEYVRRIYEDVQSVGNRIRTAVPAVNALISAKAADCEEHGIALETTILSSWAEMPVPGWEMCRIIGNLADNAMDVLLESSVSSPAIRITISEDIRSWQLTVENNGPEIPRAHRRDIFLPGFTTKSAGRGNGLSIISDLMEKYGGELQLHSDSSTTRFSCIFPKQIEINNTTAE